MIAMRLFNPSDLLTVSLISLNVRTIGDHLRRDALASRQWLASVDSYCSSVIISLNLAKDLNLDVHEIAFPLSTAGHEQAQLVSKRVTNIMFEA